MRVLLTAIHIQLRRHFAAELGLGQHALDRFFNNLFRLALKQANEGLFAQAAGETGVAAIDLALALEAGEAYLLRVDHDHVVAHINKRRIFGISLATEHTGRFGCQTSQGLAVCVQHEPLAADLVRARNIRRHLYLSPANLCVETLFAHARRHRGNIQFPRQDIICSRRVRSYNRLGFPARKSPASKTYRQASAGLRKDFRVMDFEGEVNSQLGFPPISTRSRAMSADLIEFFKDLGLSERGPRNCQWPTYRHHGTRRYL